MIVANLSQNNPYIIRIFWIRLIIASLYNLKYLTRLKKFTPEVLFERDGFAFITPYNNALRALVVARPLNSYLENTAVAPVVEGRTGGVGHD